MRENLREKMEPSTMVLLGLFWPPFFVDTPMYRALGFKGPGGGILGN